MKTRALFLWKIGHLLMALSVIAFYASAVVIVWNDDAIVMFYRMLATSIMSFVFGAILKEVSTI